MKWISVKNKLPRENTYVLTYSPGFDSGSFYPGHKLFHDGKFYYCHIPDSNDDKVSHWMSLPVPPK